MPRIDPSREATIAAAIRAIQHRTPGCESISKASAVFHIPKETLRRRIHGTPKPQPANDADSKLLTDAQEEQLVAYLRRSVDIGFAVTSGAVSGAAQSILRSAGSDDTVSSNWSAHFITRHPEFRSGTTPSAADAPQSAAAAAERAQALEEKLLETESKISEADLDRLRAKAATAQLKADRAMLKSLRATEKAMRTRARVAEAEAGLEKDAMTWSSAPVARRLGGSAEAWQSPSPVAKRRRIGLGQSTHGVGNGNGNGNGGNGIRRIGLSRNGYGNGHVINLEGEGTPAEQMMVEQGQRRSGQERGMAMMDDWRMEPDL